MLGQFLISIAIVYVSNVLVRILLAFPTIEGHFSVIASNLNCVMPKEILLKNTFRHCVCDHADINECATNNGGCSHYATCHNFVGGYTCTCNQGYTGNGHRCKGMSS